jgi:hypothetical protein
MALRILGLGFLLLAAAFPAGAQQAATGDQASVSLGDVARQQRAAHPAKPAKVFTNDDLAEVNYDNGAVIKDKTDDKEQPGSAAPPPAATKKAEGGADSVAEDRAEDARRAKNREELLAQCVQQEKALDLLKRERDVLQKQAEVQASMYYLDAGSRLNDPRAFTALQTNYQNDIAAKQQQVEEAQHRLDALKDQAHKAGVPLTVLESE